MAPASRIDKAGLYDSRSGLIEPDLLEFVRTSIRSVWTLELVLAMRRHPERSFTPAELVAELRASDLVVSEGLTVLGSAGLVSIEADGRARYAPASPALEHLVQRLEKLHRDRPTAVTKAIFSAPNDRLQVFADAFRLTRD